MRGAKYNYSAQVNATKAEVSATSGTILMAMALLNTTSAVAYLQMFFKPASEVTVGTTAPDHVIPLPASGGISWPLLGGWYLPGAGLTIAGTTSRSGSTNAAIDVSLVMAK